MNIMNTIATEVQQIKKIKINIREIEIEKQSNICKLDHDLKYLDSFKDSQDLNNIDLNKMHSLSFSEIPSITKEMIDGLINGLCKTKENLLEHYTIKINHLENLQREHKKVYKNNGLENIYQIAEILEEIS